MTSVLAGALTTLTLVVGLALALAGASVLRRERRLARRRRRLRQHGREVAGRVVDTQIHTRGRGDATARAFRPVVRFTTAEGVTVTTVAGPLTDREWYLRTPVRLRHDADDPEVADVVEPVAGSPAEQSGAAVVAAGVVLLVSGVGALVTAAVGLLGTLG
ncbi:DUF3592 domain-containing protein [Pseudokineococcus sp. 1T1Z-3]|uniref:DUF3592 domain-containing protein n=1 Tax=Pseudokineococcus sp. 1T1Z-3 TaxID=3132745 RepID=UPI0030B734AB